MQSIFGMAKAFNILKVMATKFKQIFWTKLCYLSLANANNEKPFLRIFVKQMRCIN